MSGRRPFDFLIATDLDGTLVGDPEALARLNRDLTRVRHRVALAYVTGRVLRSTLALIEAEGLLRPDAIIAGVGTTIHAGPRWASDAAWERRMRHGWREADVDAAAAAVPSLARQPEDAQGPFKRSFWVPPGEARRAIGLLSRELRARGVLARLIYSSDRDLDVLPLRGGKGPASIYLAGRLGVRPDYVIACGDSGNDVDLLAAGGSSAVVANALPELLQRAPAHAYFADAPFAGGVHEALRHYGVV